MKVWLNGAIVPAEEAKVSVLDRGFLYGDAVFETMAVTGGAIFRMKQHWDRFCRSAGLVGLEVPFSEGHLREQLQAVLQANGCRDAVLRVSLTRGISGRGLGTEGCRDQTLLILCFPPRIYPRTLRERGAKVVVSTVRRVPDAALPSAAKTANYLNGILAYREAMAASADEALMLTVSGEIAEGTVSNIFLVGDEGLTTPAVSCGILPGITRAAVIELAGTLGIACRESRVSEHALDHASEIFYTNTTAGIMPVGCIGARLLNAPGPVTRRLAEGYLEMVKRESGGA